MREIDDEFLPEERLYLRLPPLLFGEPKGTLLLSQIRFPDFSVNRGKYSAPADVLKPNWLTWGVVSFTVADIPEKLDGDDGKGDRVSYFFKPVDCPETFNEAHAEVRSFDANWRSAMPGKVVKTVFREMLRQKLKIEVEAAPI